MKMANHTFTSYVFSKVGDELRVDRGKIVSYVLHVEIRNKFPSLWTLDSEDR